MVLVEFYLEPSLVLLDSAQGRIATGFTRIWAFFTIFCIFLWKVGGLFQKATTGIDTARWALFGIGLGANRFQKYWNPNLRYPARIKNLSWATASQYYHWCFGFFLFVINFIREWTSIHLNVTRFFIIETITIIIILEQKRHWWIMNTYTSNISLLLRKHCWYKNESFIKDDQINKSAIQ